MVLIDGPRSATWPELLRWSSTLAAHWSDRVDPGERVAIDGANSLDHLLAELACWQLGAIAVPLPAGLAADQRQRLLAEVEPVLIAHQVPEAFSATPSAAVLTATVRAVQPEDPCLLLFTSGSSGTPRGVLLSHDNLCSQQAAFAMHWPDIGPGDRLAAYLPWHHSFGALAERLWALCRGATLTVVPGAGRDRAALLATLLHVRPTVFMSVPKIHRLVTDTAGSKEAAWWSELRWAFTAGAALSEREAAFYQTHGIMLYEGWGLTECSPSATLTTPDATETAPGTVGHPIAGTSVGVAPDGRIYVSGPGVMLGYWRRPAATAQVLCGIAGLGGIAGLDATMLDTGDLGEWTAAGLRLTGRADHTIKLANGEKIHLGEMARALEAQPGIRHAVVFSPDGDHLQAVVSGPHSSASASAVVAAINAAEPLPWRRITRVFRLGCEPTVGNGLLTPSHKIARAAWLAAAAAADDGDSAMPLTAHIHEQAHR